MNRSKNNLVHFANQFVRRIPRRLKNTPIIPVQKDNGLLKLVRYRSGNLITPLVDDILTTELIGTTCVLTKTNEEALQITGLLVNKGLRAKLVQSNEGFNLYNLQEVRFFLGQIDLDEGIYIIGDDTWNYGKRRLIERFSNSKNLDIGLRIICDFEAVNPKYKYKSDLEMFIRESRLEDFIGGNSDTIFVSTIHKAKGREFDNVFLLLDKFNSNSDEANRQLYVAMTRAKRSLIIHYNGSYLDNINTQVLQFLDDDNAYLLPNQFSMQLTHRDVWLDFFYNCQYLLAQLTSGDRLVIDDGYCTNTKGQRIVKFSKQYLNQMEILKLKNYIPYSAKVNFIVFWQKEDTKHEISIVLPEVLFVKR